MGKLRGAVRVFLVLLISLVVLQGKDVLRLSAVEELASSHLYSLVQWEAANLFDKWVHRITVLLPGGDTAGDGTPLVHEYFRLGELERGLAGSLEEALFSANAESVESVEENRVELEKTRGRRLDLRDAVEELLEGQLDAAIFGEGLSQVWPLRALGIHFPPVDFRLDQSPRVLVVSPRDRIEMIDGILIKPTITLADMDSLERLVLEVEDLSALVEGTSGVATYPAVISPDHSLRGLLTTAAHEWLHHYLFFRPLGQSYGSDGETTSLNETLATIFGREIGELVYRQHYDQPAVSATVTPAVRSPTPAAEFDFRQEMRETRLETERMLDEGRVEEAEAYMEQRRLVMADNGYPIRKLNQAYFAFHGTYADSPASVSPIYDQLSAQRDASASLGDFVRQVASFSTYADFLDSLDQVD